MTIRLINNYYTDGYICVNNLINMGIFKQTTNSEMVKINCY